jgi:hypothetical protein
MDEEGPTPLDLPRLRQWIGQLVENYDALASRGDIGYSLREIRQYREALISVGRACDGEFKRPLKVHIRELLARNLLSDLADPRRAGCALTGMAIAHTSYAPRRGATQRRVAKWALLVAIGATAG